MADTLQDINDRNFTGKVESVNPQDVFLSMGLQRDPTSMNLTAPKEEEKPSLFTIGADAAQMKLLSTVRGAYTYAQRQLTAEPGYEPFKDPQLLERGNDFILANKDGLGSVTSEWDMARTLKAADDYQNMAEEMSKRPFASFAFNTLAAAPEALAMVLPGAAAVSVGTRALSLAASGALYGSASTLGEQQLNANLTNKDVIDNSMYGAVLGAGLPLLFHGLASKQMKDAVNFMGGKIKKPNLGSEAGAIDYSVLPESERQLSTAGAKSTALDPEGERAFVPDNFSGAVFKKAQQGEAYIAPAQVAATSDSATTVQWGNETYLSGLTNVKNTQGIKNETNIFMDVHAQTGNSITTFNNGLKKAFDAEGGFETFGHTDYNEFLNKARDDMFANKNTPGAAFLKKFMNDYAVKSNNEKLLGEDVVLDEHGNHFPGSLSRDKITMNPVAFKEMNTTKFEQEQSLAQNRLNELTKGAVDSHLSAAETKGESFDPYTVLDADNKTKLEFIRKSGKATEEGVTPEHHEELDKLSKALLGKQSISERVDELINHLLNPVKEDKFSKNTSAGSLKAKTVGYSYEEAKPYLPDNSLQVMTSYIRNMEVESAIRKKYGIGSKEYVKHFQEKIQNDYAILLEKSKDNPVEMARLEKASQRDQEMVRQTYNVLTNKYNQPDTLAGVTMNAVSRIVSGFISTIYLGMAAMANLPDLSNLAGLRNAMWLGKGVKDCLGHMGTLKLSKEEAEFAHICMNESAPTNSAMEMIGLDSSGILNQQSGFATSAAEKMDAGVRKFFKISGFNYFVNLERRLAGSWIGNKIIRAAAQLEEGTLQQGTKEFNDLHKFGIDKTNVKAIMDEVRAHSVTKTGVAGNSYTFLNTHEWKPSVGIEFTSNLLREIENSISSRTVGDAPFWTNNTWARLFTAFKGWQLGALNRQVLPMIQGWGMGKEYKAVVLSRIIANMCWANATDYMMNIANNRAEKNDNITLNRVLYNGFNRGNMFPIFADMSNIADSQGLGLGTLLGVNNSSRYYDTDVLGKFGPALGLPSHLVQAGQSMHKIVTGKATGADIRKAARIIPGSNLPGIGWAINEIGKHP